MQLLGPFDRLKEKWGRRGDGRLWGLAGPGIMNGL